MTDLEINKQLALSIGYLPRDMFQQKSTVTDDEYQMVRHENSWCCFDYKDWETIGPIAERYDLFPKKAAWSAYRWSIVTDKVGVFADIPQKAIALAVIGIMRLKNDLAR